jgi:23S rRNA maturation-related 3'-5' exoribonuclease YhaM
MKTIEDNDTVKKWSINDLEDEISQIPNEEIRAWTRTALSSAPELFWVVPASKTKRFHPKDESKEGGNVRHTQRAFRAMQVLCDADADILNEEEISMMLSAILLHDIAKGMGRPHEELVYPYFKTTMGVDFVTQYPDIFDLVASHMGRWSNRRPQTKMEFLVHYADNIASKIHIISGFDNDMENL